MSESLDHFRQSIDNIDAALIYMLAERFKITQAVGRYKAETGLPPADPGQEGAVLRGPAADGASAATVRARTTERLQLHPG